MRTRTFLIAGAVATVAAASLSPAQAGTPQPFKKTVKFIDATPDPSGTGGTDNAAHCKGELPREKPVAVTLPGPGVVEVFISGFTGDWSLMITDPSDKVLGGSDTNPPETEAAKVTLKKAGTINILPCNLIGTSEATLTYSYRYKKP